MNYARHYMGSWEVRNFSMKRTATLSRRALLTPLMLAAGPYLYAISATPALEVTLADTSSRTQSIMYWTLAKSTRSKRIGELLKGLGVAA